MIIHREGEFIMSKAEKLINEDGEYFAKSGRIKYYPLAIDHGFGATLVDVDGKEYIDLLSSASSQNIGHAPKKVTDAIKRQAEKFVHYTPAYMYHEPLVRLSKKLCDIAPGDDEKRVAFGLSGSDANDGIIKFARAYTGRPYIISFTNAYHGSTFGALSMSAISLNMRKHYSTVSIIFHFLINIEGCSNNHNLTQLKNIWLLLKRCLQSMCQLRKLHASWLRRFKVTVGC